MRPCAARIAAGGIRTMEKHLFGLDGLRFLAAIAVVGFHFLFRGEAAGDLPQMPLPEMLKSAAAYGYLGVSIFFIISGFVILYSAEGRTPLEFFVSRFVRIYPTFVVMMTVTALVVVVAANPRFEVSLEQYGANLMVFSLLLGEPFVDGAYWSIVLELVFYGWVFLLLVIRRLDDIETIAFGWLALSFANEAFFQVRLLQDALITEYSGFFVAGIALQRLGKGVTPARLLLLGLSLSYGVFTSLRAAAWFEAEYGSALSRPVIAAAVLGGGGAVCADRPRGSSTPVMGTAETRRRRHLSALSRPPACRLCRDPAARRPHPSGRRNPARGRRYPRLRLCLSRAGGALVHAGPEGAALPPASAARPRARPPTVVRCRRKRLAKIDK